LRVGRGVRAAWRICRGWLVQLRAFLSRCARGLGARR
jgi:hypothetical protein